MDVCISGIHKISDLDSYYDYQCEFERRVNEKDEAYRKINQITEKSENNSKHTMMKTFKHLHLDQSIACAED
ncbi:7012_t:CDS:2 [Ambispora leptoticha]|uniref:7012_t:CDS:1 n=1 Tax=Ambispora leptoticha TaxID=144679 RepID=A0A9N8YSD3_9GLOM|nr:7012_t:CDS:2 [Ambispora leptoticha]